MCNVGDDIEEQENAKFMPGKQQFNLAENKCMKCRTAQPKVVLHNKYPYCASCFLAATVHKFKALLGKNRVVHPNDNVLVCHRVGHPSTALLHFLRAGLDLTTPKKIRFKPIVIFIENHFNLPLQQRTKILQEIKEEVNTFSFQLHFVSLTQYAQNPEDLSSLIQQDYEKLRIGDEDRVIIKNIIKKKANFTTQQEILKIFERELLINAAKLLKCKSIFTPDVGIDIASQFLTSISLGRGAHVAFDIGIVDCRDATVSLLKPLRNFNVKELAFYNILNNLEPVSFLDVVENPYSSVQSLMAKFVSDLQVNYPATVSTIVRTGDKLCIDKDLKQNEQCPLCKAPLENKSDKLGSAEATNFSHWVSTQAPNINISLAEHSTQLLDTFKNSYELTYCFACSGIVNFL